MPAQVPRPYQAAGLRQIAAAFHSGARKVLVVAPTGSGKTTLFTYFLHRLKAPALILVHRRELATQAADRLREFGVDFGFIMAGEKARPHALVQIASVQTIVRRLEKRLPPARFVICDEAHLSTADTWQRTLDAYPDANVLGVTATPWRLGGKPLAGAYDQVVVVATPSQLREQGHLCGFAGFSYKTPDLSKVQTTAGEYNEKQSAEAMREPSIVANIVEKWLAHASHLSTVVFAVTVEHSLELTAQFVAAGVRAEHLDGKTADDKRRAILRRVASGETQVLCNVGVAVEGLDIPRLKCCVLARPTKSLARAIQMMGRVRRPWQGQTARIHDHAFLIRQHGLPDDERDYRLDAKPEKPPSLTQCEQCFALYSGAVCPSCAHENAPQMVGPREIVTVADAEAYEFDSASAPAAPWNPESMAPVSVHWDRVGMMREGLYTGSEVMQTHYGAGRFYRIVGKQRVYHLPGTAHLNECMTRVKIGEWVRVTQLEEQALGGDRYKKKFRVEVDR